MISRKRLEDAGLILLLAAIVLALQLYSGAYTSDFSADDDEAGHAVSSLMVHDYIVHGLRTNPMAYAQQFYIHYPKVAIGHWPPLFYAGEAGWMLLAGRNRLAMIAFEALLAIGLLVGVFWWVRRDLGIGPALLAAIALIVPEFMQTSIATVAPNLALAFLAFWAAAVLGRYLDFGKRRDAVLFVVFAIVAVGVHGRGAMVALLPLALLLTGRFEWTRFRAAALMVALTFVAVAPRLLHQARLPTISGVPRLVGNYLYRSGNHDGLADSYPRDHGWSDHLPANRRAAPLACDGWARAQRMALSFAGGRQLGRLLSGDRSSRGRDSGRCGFQFLLESRRIEMVTVRPARYSLCRDHLERAPAVPKT